MNPHDLLVAASFILSLLFFSFLFLMFFYRCCRLGGRAVLSSSSDDSVRSIMSGAEVGRLSADCDTGGFTSDAGGRGAICDVRNMFPRGVVGEIPFVLTIALTLVFTFAVLVTDVSMRGLLAAPLRYGLLMGLLPEHTISSRSSMTAGALRLRSLLVTAVALRTTSGRDHLPAESMAT